MPSHFLRCKKAWKSLGARFWNRKVPIAIDESLSTSHVIRRELNASCLKVFHSTFSMELLLLAPPKERYYGPRKRPSSVRIGFA